MSENSETEVIDWEHMAPPDPTYHLKYALTMEVVFDALMELQMHPSHEEGEDLKDYVDALIALVSFHPRTHENIEQAAQSTLRRSSHHGDHQQEDEEEGQADA